MPDAFRFGNQSKADFDSRRARLPDPFYHLTFTLLKVQ